MYVFELWPIFISGGFGLVPKYISYVSASPSGSLACQLNVGVKLTPLAPFEGFGLLGSVECLID